MQPAQGGDAPPLFGLRRSVEKGRTKDRGRIAAPPPTLVAEEVAEPSQSRDADTVV